MKPTPEELRRLLAARPVPEPSGEARDRALRAALAVHRRALAMQVREGRVKENGSLARPMGKPDKGGPVMRKLAYAASVLVFLGIAAAIAIPNFLQFRMKAKSRCRSA